jgi:hypothetical protein
MDRIRPWEPEPLPLPLPRPAPRELDDRHAPRPSSPGLEDERRGSYVVVIDVG